MTTIKYQTWEEEMEAPGLEEKAVSFMSVFFSAILGILLVLIVLLKSWITSPSKTKAVVADRFVQKPEACEFGISQNA